MRWILLAILAAAPFASAQDCVPSWFNGLPRDNPGWLFATGKGSDAEAARKDAARNMSDRLSPLGEVRLAEVVAFAEQDGHQECEGRHYALLRVETSRVKNALDLARREVLVSKSAAPAPAAPKDDKRAQIVIHNVPPGRSEALDRLEVRLQQLEKTAEQPKKDRQNPPLTALGALVVICVGLVGYRTFFRFRDIADSAPTTIIVKHEGLESPLPSPARSTPDPELVRVIEAINKDVERNRLASAVERAHNACIRFSDAELAALRDRLRSKTEAEARAWIDGQRRQIRCPRHPDREPGNSGAEGQRLRAIKGHLMGENPPGHRMDEAEADLMARMILDALKALPTTPA